MNSINSEPIVLLVYGEGGHEAQMMRLATGLSASNHQKFIALTDSSKRHAWCDDYFLVNEVRGKHRSQWFGTVSNVLRIFKQLASIRKQHKVQALISTGPGLSVIAAVFVKILCGARIIHVETWSRFYSRSLTGRVMYWLADVFYIQNHKLASLYPKAVYSGRL
jgi:UDP-N-acetylglucosamine:LPS N-acetylglucosamine transferase